MSRIGHPIRACFGVTCSRLDASDGASEGWKKHLGSLISAMFFLNEAGKFCWRVNRSRYLIWHFGFLSSGKCYFYQGKVREKSGNFDVFGNYGEAKLQVARQIFLNISFHDENFILILVSDIVFLLRPFQRISTSPCKLLKSRPSAQPKREVSQWLSKPPSRVL